MRIMLLPEIYSEGCEHRKGNEKCGERTSILLLSEEEHEKYRDLLDKDIDEAVRNIYPDQAGLLLCGDCFQKHIKEIKEVIQPIDGSMSIGSLMFTTKATQN